ncbi:MAG: hypothetical protein V1765_02870 [bacterium]
MDQLISEILQDLYKLEPNLQVQEKTLIKLIHDLIQAKPQTHFTSGFKKALAKELQQQISGSKITNNNFNFMNNWFNKFALAGVGVLLITAIWLVPKFINRPTDNNVAQQLASLDLNGQLNIKTVGKKAFGPLAINQDNGGEIMTNQSATVATRDSAGASAPAGGSGRSLAAPVMAESIGVSAISKDIAIGIMPPYEQTNYKFVYTGEEIIIDQPEMPIYKRIKGNNSGKQLAQALADYDLGFIKISSLRQPKVDNINIVEDKKDGYFVNISLTEETLGLYRNRIYPQTATAEIYRPITDSDMLSDDKLIAMANDWLSQYGIDISAYGTPEIDQQWQIYYAQAPAVEKAMYIPEVMSVVYPLKINNSLVYEEGGSKSGFRVNISLRYQDIESLWGLTSNTFEASNYTTVQDVKKLIGVAERGGWRNSYPMLYDENNGPIKNVEIKLGTPTIEYIKLYNYQPAEGTADELLVPCLVFPITNKPDEGYFWQNNVIVPIIEEVLNWEQNLDRPVTPLLENGSGAMIKTEAVDTRQ